MVSTMNLTNEREFSWLSQNMGARTSRCALFYGVHRIRSELGFMLMVMELHTIWQEQKHSLKMGFRRFIYGSDSVQCNISQY